MAVRIPARKTPARLPEITVINPGKGLNNLVSDTLIRNEESSDLNNIQFVESGAISKSSGIQAVGAGLSNNPKGLGTFYTVAGNKYLLTVDGTSLKYLSGSTWTAISGATFTSGKEINFTQCDDALYIWNGLQAGCKLDNALTLTRLSTAPSAAFGIWYSGLQIVSGVATKPNRIYINDSTISPGKFTNSTGTLSNSTEVPGATDFSSGTGANYVDVNVGDGDKITGFSKFQGVLIIFKERSVYQLTLTTAGVPTITQITQATGAVSHKSIDNVENDVFYLSRKGYYVLGNEPNYTTANVRTNELSNRVNPIIQTINMAQANKATSIFSDFKFYSSFATGGNTYNNQTLIYDRRYTAWSKTDYMTANSWAEYIDSNGAKHLYFASDSTNEVYEVIDGYYSIDGTAMDSYWVSKSFDANNFDQYKRWLDVTILFRQLSGSVTVTFYADNNAIVKSTTINSDTTYTGSMGSVMMGSPIFGGTGSASTSGTTNNIPYRFKVNTKSRSLKIKISNSSNNENFIVLGFSIAFVDYNRQSWPSSLKIQ